MDRRTQPQVYDAYLVRLWRDSQESAWRASAQSIWDGQVYHFSNLPALFAFLEMRSSKPHELEPGSSSRAG